MAEGAVDERSATDQRRMMVDGQIRTFDVTDQRVLEVFYRTPRETSLPGRLVPLTYSDALLVLPSPEPGHDGRALMPPMFLAKLLQGAELVETHRVLVVAGGTGYVAATVAPLVAEVVSLECAAAWTAVAADYLASLGLSDKVKVVTGPLAAGHPEGAPYDRIIVAGAVETDLDELCKQLANGGCLLAIETRGHHASRRSGKAVRLDKVAGVISGRTLFDATMPVIDAFRAEDRFVF